MSKILIIEDEPNIRELVKYNLEANGYEAVEAEDGNIGMTKVYTEKPDLVLLDIMLPKKDGYEICKEMRSEGNNTPIIMLTAKTEEIDKVLGLEFGADDYIPKPFGVRELMARIKAVLRRYDISEAAAAPEESPVVSVDGLRMDFSRREVTLDGEEIDLTFKEFELLGFLAKNRGHVFTRDELLDKVWGIDYAGETRTVDVHIRYLRKKLGDSDERFIETIRGKGYRMR